MGVVISLVGAAEAEVDKDGDHKADDGDHRHADEDPHQRFVFACKIEKNVNRS